jgi:hypothetical protein
MSDPDDHYVGYNVPALDGAAELVRITVSMIPLEVPEGMAGAVSIEVEVGHPFPASVINAREVFTLIHKMLPSMERRVRNSWVEHRKVCTSPTGEGEADQ